MAIKFFTGFEANDLTVNSWTVVGDATISTTHKRTGSYALKCTTTAGTSYISKSSISGYRYSFGIRITVMPDADTVIFKSNNITLKLGTDGYITMYEGTVPRGICHYALDDSGWFRLSLGIGDALYSWFAVNSSKQIHTVDCSDYSGTVYIGIQTTCTAEIYFDDFVSDDTYSLTDLGNCKVVIAIPSAAGTYQEWTASAGTHLSCIDDAPGSVSDADYIAANSTNIEDTFNLPDYETLGILATDTILAVNVLRRVWASDTATGGLFPCTVDNGVFAFGSAETIGTTKSWKTTLYNTMPADSGAWTLARFNSFEIGVARKTISKTLYCSALWAEVMYSTTEAGTVPDEAPETMINAVWKIPGKWIQIEQNGVVFLCVMKYDSTATRIYKSISYGRYWTLEAEYTGFLIDMVCPTNTALTSFLFTSSGKMYWIGNLGDTPVERTGFGSSDADTFIRCKYVVYAGVAIPVILCSYNSFTGHLGIKVSLTRLGTTWTTIFDSYQPGSGNARYAIFSNTNAWLFTHGTTSDVGSIKFIPDIDTPLQPFWTPYDGVDNQGQFGYEGDWTQKYRTYRPGIDESAGLGHRLVLGAYWSPYNTKFAYSDDSGATFTAKDIPADMQPTYSYPDYDITCFNDLVLAHCVACATPGIYRSDDFGDTWTKVRDPLDTGEVFCGVQIDPYSTAHVYAWGRYGFAYSEDYGVTWNWEGYVLEGEPDEPTNYIVVPLDPQIRVSSITHYVSFGKYGADRSYQMEVNLGGLTSGINITKHQPAESVVPVELPNPADFPQYEPPAGTVTPSGGGGSLSWDSKPYRCPYCPLSFKTKLLLQSHIIWVHPKMPQGS